MAEITLRVLDGADRGRVFADLQTPVTIGREEGNTIQLNDERVSRFHVKIQEDQEKLVITDLESTNGSKVNGEDIQLRILRYGDVIHVGRSLLLFGTREQIAARLAELRGQESKDRDDPQTMSPEQLAAKLEGASLDFELRLGDPDLRATLHSLQPPELPERLGPGQSAQLAELLEYIHIRIRDLISSVKMKENGERVTLDARQWQNLLDLQSRVAEYHRSVADPDGRYDG
jgi:pSer/pThr/pTyr-binding forkhead associated (FHA) protein